MFNASRKDQHADSAATTLIASGTEIHGDIRFTGRLHVDGKIEGAITGDGAQAMLTLSEHATVHGEVIAPNILIDGKVVGDVTAGERLELARNAHVEGNIYYKLLEMAAGAQINGKMVYRAEPQRQLPKPDVEANAFAERQQKTGTS